MLLGGLFHLHWESQLSLCQRVYHPSLSLPMDIFLQINITVLNFFPSTFAFVAINIIYEQQHVLFLNYSPLDIKFNMMHTLSLTSGCLCRRCGSNCNSCCYRHCKNTLKPLKNWHLVHRTHKSNSLHYG